jgi:hypothetical protein
LYHAHCFTKPFTQLYSHSNEPLDMLPNILQYNLGYKRAKMADDVSQQIKNVLNMIVNFKDKSGNLKKELKNSIHEAVIWEI